MKIGDIHVMDGWKFELIGFDGEGRQINKRLCLSDEQPKREVEAAVVIEEPVIATEKTKSFEGLTKTDVNRTPKEKLEAMCKELGLTLGTTAEMKKEIIAHLGL